MAERTGRSALFVGGGAAVAALSGVLFLVLSARALSTEDNTAFLTYWAALFAVFAVLAGVQNEMTRAVRADAAIPAGEKRRTSPLAASLFVGAVAAAVVVLLLPLWQVVFAGLPDQLVAALLIALAALFYAGHVGTVGTLAGAGHWEGFAALTAAESLVRLGLAVATALVGWGVVGFEISAAAGVVTWVVATLLLPRWRLAWRLRVALPLSALLRRLLNAIAAAGASAILVTGFPLLMSLTTEPAAYATAAPLVVAVSVTRAPLLIPVTAFQSMVIAAFVGSPERARSSLVRLIAVLVGVAAVGGGLAAAVGPWIMAAVFGPDYANTPLVLGLLVVAAALLALLFLGGSVTLAMDAHTVNTAGWYAALVVSIGLMLLPAGLETRTILALTVGPLIGAAIHFGFVVRALGKRSRKVAP